MNAFEMAQSQFDGVAAQLNLEPGVASLLRWPMREFRFQIPVRMDDGAYKIFKGYRVQHNNLLGPFKGGLRYHHEANLDEMKALAAWPPK